VIFMGIPFPAGGTAGAVDYNGINPHGGIDNNEQEVGDVNNDPASDAGLPKGVSKYGGSDNNEQPGNEN
jgi:hypothetical protein